jgi:hypothetical protein
VTTSYKPSQAAIDAHLSVRRPKELAHRGKPTGREVIEEKIRAAVEAEIMQGRLALRSL